MNKELNAPERFFSFSKRDWKIFPHISWEMAYYFFTTHGVPVENYIDMMKKQIASMTAEEVTAIVQHDLELWEEEQLTK